MHAADVDVMKQAITAFRNWQTQANGVNVVLTQITFTINDQPNTAFWNSEVGDYEISSSVVSTPPPVV